MRSVPAPCHHHQPCYVPRPAWASDRPGLLTQAWVRHSPTTIQRRLLHCLGTALRIGHHPHRRPSEGRREAGRGGWGGRDAPGACTDPGDSEGVLEPPSPLRFKWRGAGGDPAHPLEPGPPIFPRQGGGWLRTLDRP